MDQHNNYNSIRQNNMENTRTHTNQILYGNYWNRNNPNIPNSPDSGYDISPQSSIQHQYSNQPSTQNHPPNSCCPANSGYASNSGSTLQSSTQYYHYPRSYKLTSSTQNVSPISDYQFAFPSRTRNFNFPIDEYALLSRSSTRNLYLPDSSLQSSCQYSTQNFSATNKVGHNQVQVKNNYTQVLPNVPVNVTPQANTQRLEPSACEHLANLVNSISTTSLNNNQIVSSSKEAKKYKPRTVKKKDNVQPRTPISDGSHLHTSSCGQTEISGFLQQTTTFTTPSEKNYAANILPPNEYQTNIAADIENPTLNEGIVPKNHNNISHQANLQEDFISNSSQPEKLPTISEVSVGTPLPQDILDILNDIEPSDILEENNITEEFVNLDTLLRNKELEIQQRQQQQGSSVTEKPHYSQHHPNVPVSHTERRSREFVTGTEVQQGQQQQGSFVTGKPHYSQHHPNVPVSYTERRSREFVTGTEAQQGQQQQGSFVTGKPHYSQHHPNVPVSHTGGRSREFVTGAEVQQGQQQQGSFVTGTPHYSQHHPNVPVSHTGGRSREFVTGAEVQQGQQQQGSFVTGTPHYSRHHPYVPVSHTGERSREFVTGAEVQRGQQQQGSFVTGTPHYSRHHPNVPVSHIRKRSREFVTGKIKVHEASLTSSQKNPLPTSDTTSEMKYETQSGPPTTPSHLTSSGVEPPHSSQASGIVMGDSPAEVVGVDSLLLSPWAANGPEFLEGGVPDVKQTTGFQDTSWVDSLMLGSTVNVASAQSLMEIKGPLPAFTNYTGHLSINGISGHHYHTIASSGQRSSVPSASPTPSSNQEYYESPVVSSSTPCPQVSQKHQQNHHQQQQQQHPQNPHQPQQQLPQSTQQMEYDIDDIAEIIGSAIADTTVPGNGNGPSSEQTSDTSRDWIDIADWIIPECSPKNQETTSPNSFAPQIYVTTTPTMPTQQHAGSTLQNLLTQNYAPLLQARLQAGNAPGLQNASCGETPSSTSPYPPLSPPNRVSTSCSPDDLLHSSFATPSHPRKRSRSSPGSGQNPSKKNPAVNTAVLPYGAESEVAGNPKKPVHRCHICNRAFLNKSNIKVHLRTHTGEKPFKCDVCSKAFRQKAHLIKHQQIHKRGGRE